MDKKAITLVLDKELFENVKQKAKELGLTTTALIRMTIINYINENEK